jgi:hypothetical protein
MFCNKCGKEVDDDAVVCIGCGCSLKTEASSPQSSEGAGCFLSVLSFLIPLLGLILYLVWKDSRPVASKACGKSALWGVIVGVVLWVISMLMIGAAVSSSGYY